MIEVRRGATSGSPKVRIVAEGRHVLRFAPLVSVC